ncbi:lipopolysaccharide-induced tumor necrosis factor-alpha factor homolog isoform X2 [Colossoma macropomum]|uniref:lipopolysaccharide-induced tumor necrosis factor-alpha factor homolog isoform X2 n=1 Tax=Colossoma macropomum TaxID=42526 RepID=UPI001863E822|nr:lipopolysaccharide-induced tumor necrosis factor-alpha factor homolog isoform X2 [Colossoma macropomum]
MTPVVPEGAQLDQLSRELWYVVMRRQQLLSRQIILLEMQEFLKNNSVTDDGAEGKKEKEEEEEGPSELERVQKELQYLSEKEKELVNRRCLSEKQTIIVEKTQESSATEPDCIIPEKKKDLVFSGVRVLPSVTPTQRLITEQPASELTSTGLSPESSDEVVAVQDLSFSAAKVYCPNCQQQVTTEIHYKVGRSSFLVCFFSVSLGCVAGCCLLPFFLNYFKDISHRCPSCHTEIQTVHRL